MEEIELENMLSNEAKMSKVSLKIWLYNLRQQIIVFLLVFGLAILPIIFWTKETAAIYVVLLMGILWLTQLIPLAITALIPVVLFPLFGVLSARQVSTVYLTDNNFVFMGSMIMALAMEKTGFHERVALWNLLHIGTDIRRLMLGFQISTAFLSMWISNTAATAMMMPIAFAVISVLENNGKSRVNKTDTLLHSDSSEHEEDVLYNSMNDEPERKTNNAILLAIGYSASVGGIATLIGTGSNIVLSGNLLKLYSGNTPITFASWMAFTLPPVLAILLFIWLWLQYLYVPFNSTRRQEGSDDRVNMMLRKRYEDLGPMRFDEKLVLIMFTFLAVLWLTREPKFICGWSFLLPKGVSDGTAAMFIAIILFILPAENPFRRPESNQQYRTLMTWDDMKHFPWDTLFLLGGGYAMAEGVELSQLSEKLGVYLGTLSTIPQWSFVLLCSTLVTFITEFSSNVATASIFIPIVNQIARSSQINPLLYIVPTAMGCSYAFMLPAATPPNAIVFSSRTLKVSEMAKSGIAIKIFAVAITTLALYTYGWQLFELGVNPDWAQQNYTSIII